MKPLIKITYSQASKKLGKFIGSNQLHAMVKGCNGEEGEYFIAKLEEYEQRINTMPHTYQQDGLGDNAIAYLHYFTGGCDWYITEKDVGDPSDTDTGTQYQAFGLANLGYGGELGYISINDLVEDQVDFDLHFKPTTIGALKNKRSKEVSVESLLPSIAILNLTK